MKRNRIGGQWSPRLIEMLESPAYRVLSVSAHRVISRIEIEHASHGGSENGNLPVTKQNFMDYGMDHNAVAPAIREAEALGFIRMKPGRGGNADHRQPNRFFLTFAHGRGSRAYPPTHEWRKIKTIEEAKPSPTQPAPQRTRGQRNLPTNEAAKKQKTGTENPYRNRYGKPVPKMQLHRYGKPVLRASTENPYHYLYLGVEGGGKGRRLVLEPRPAPSATSATAARP